ncbi:hypothetical protein, partial [Tessaracoccus sp. OH4464_COT-324]|uniref:hypothetical protein n=1 Tax=Tessaracoccus sp. OH4464_COT-324 TaxID=2491059 RepID=UPI001319EF4D
VTVGRIQESLSKIAPAIAKTQEVLRSAAETCVEVANTIIDLFKSLIEFLINTSVVSAVLAIFTFGLSMAAQVAAVLAKGLSTLAKVKRVVDRMAKVLIKLAEFMERLAGWLRDISDELKALRELVKGKQKFATFKESLMHFAKQQAATFGTKTAINPVLSGVGAPFRMPGGVGELWEGYKHHDSALDSSQDAVDSATGVPGR